MEEPGRCDTDAPIAPRGPHEKVKWHWYRTRKALRKDFGDPKVPKHVFFLGHQKTSKIMTQGENLIRHFWPASFPLYLAHEGRLRGQSRVL